MSFLRRHPNPTILSLFLLSVIPLSILCEAADGSILHVPVIKTVSSLYHEPWPDHLEPSFALMGYCSGGDLTRSHGAGQS